MRGALKTAQTVCYQIPSESRPLNAREFRILAPQTAIDRFLDDESQHLAMLEAFIRKSISLQVQTHYTQEQYDVILT